MLRAAALALGLGLAAGPAPASAAGEIPETGDVAWGCDDAGYVEPTTEYGHDVLGGTGEYKGLLLLVHTDLGVIPATFRLPNGQVFEDLAPRCADLDGDGDDEVIAVVSDARQGARLVVYSKRSGPLAETPPIGQSFRWLAPVGVADLDGDGSQDIAYVETPHLAGVLRVWTLREGRLVELASAAGFSNHRIGQDFVTGGVRNCGASDAPQLVLPNRDWSALMRVRLDDGHLVAESIGDATDPASVAAALDCAPGRETNGAASQ